jgi:hypothetical protein
MFCAPYRVATPRVSPPSNNEAEAVQILGPCGICENLWRSVCFQNNSVLASLSCSATQEILSIPQKPATGLYPEADERSDM